MFIAVIVENKIGENKMSWLMILGLAAIVFFNRYYFLEPNVKVKLPVLMNKMLNYSAPCLLSAICIPVSFLKIMN